MSKNVLLILFTLACFLLIMQACKKQEQEIKPISERVGTITLQEAQNWYIQQLSHQTAVNSKARTTKNIKREPLWKFAQNIYLANGVFAISVPLQYEEGQGLGRGGQAKVLFFRDKQGHLQVQILKAISDMSYLTKNKGQINKQDFSGILLMEDWQETFLNGVRYTNGKLT